MINTSRDDIILLVDEPKLGELMFSAATSVILELRKFANSKANTRQWNSQQDIVSIFGALELNRFKEWAISDLNACITCIKGETNQEVISDFMRQRGTDLTREKSIRAAKTFFKLFALKLWADKVVILPQDIRLQVPADSLDAICQSTQNELLINIRGANSNSALHTNLQLGKDRDRRATTWLRLLVCTDIYNKSKITKNTVIEILNETWGQSSKSLLKTAYPQEFLLAVASLSGEQTTSEVSRWVSEVKESKKPPRVPKDTNKKRTKKAAKRAPSQIRNELIAKELPSIYVNSEDIDTIFYAVKTHQLKNVSLLIANQHKDTLNFIDVFSDTFDAWLSSKKLQNPNNAEFSLSVARLYLALYLPKFFMERDSSLEKYPQSFNDFNCPYYVSMNDKLRKITERSGQKAPITLIHFMHRLASINEWSNETLYNRVIVLDNFFEWVEKNSLLIPCSSDFKNTISEENYARISRKQKTVKKPIPRKYFASLHSYLYALEYLAEHIDGMAHSGNLAIIDGSLRQLTLVELENANWLSRLWGVRGSYDRSDDIPLHFLNYTPIVCHQGKYYPIVICKRFYCLGERVINGNVVSTVVPHQIRTAILMCETGIRQHHIKWLDLKSFDHGVDYSSRAELEPLVVNTDKAHAEWISIVSRRVIDLCNKQKDWYLSSGVDGFDNKIWYGNKEGSRFGKFKPLFRLNSSGPFTELGVVWPAILWGLQIFIRETLGDQNTPDFVSYCNRGEEFEDGISVKSDPASLINKVLRARHTPHALRATFVTEKMRYLPASLIGNLFTGQTETLVHYYNSGDFTSLKTQADILIDKANQGILAGKNSQAPEIVAKAREINNKILNDIEQDPQAAISTHGLISLSTVQADKTGIEVVKARKHTKLAFNDTHTCPFNNTCPTEIVNQYGMGRPCSVCPYAIRSVKNLPAISAAKDRAFEMTLYFKSKINEYTKRGDILDNGDLIRVQEEYDHAVRDFQALEFTEHQLALMSQQGSDEKFLVADGKALINHYKKIDVNAPEYIFKRLLDVQNFPSQDSPGIQAKFALLRRKLLVYQGDIQGLLEDRSEAESDLLGAQLQNMMLSTGMTVSDIYRIASTKVTKSSINGNVQSISSSILSLGAVNE